MPKQEITHRDHLGPTYKGVAIHALPGLHEQVYQFALENFETGLPVLELGAGSGALSLRMRDGGFSVVPVDLDGNDWNLDIPLIEANLNEENWQKKLPAGMRFRQIVAIEVIEHLENPSGFFRDISSLLDEGGCLILSTPNVCSFHSAYALMKRGELALFSPDDCITSGHISILPWWMLQHLAARCGLAVARCEGVCEIPVAGPLKKLFVRLAARLRALVYRPAEFVHPDGLNVVLVFRKRTAGNE
ncbi:MAG: class I SAM-dependent methyltransferase [Gammaproteobacteria bacterium]|nr:class I SAM-dependent methyltransferase [Gammaproteobacteria bacterium]MBU1481671.1 class I SAM-dependent methyltransferase [Gammaproteobacteria bacterium]